MMLFSRPTLLLNTETCRSNLERMMLKAHGKNLSFRPHFKTHRSAAIGRMFRSVGVRQITVSSVSMAEYFASDGWDDILIAFPVNVRELDRINLLAEKIRLFLLLDNLDSAQYLAKNLKNRAGIYIKIDSGYHRAGLSIEQTGYISSVLDVIIHSGNMEFTGFLTHAGHTYLAGNSEGVIKAHSESVSQMHTIRNAFKQFFPDMIISAGDTPSCSIADDFQGIDEIRPGNFIFYDVQQLLLGSCKPAEIALSVACPVVAVYPGRCQAIVYAGAVHLSKDYATDPLNRNIFGYITSLENDHSWKTPWPDTYVTSLSQEHGLIQTSPGQINRFRVGDVIGILPAHACLTAYAMGEYVTTGGKKISMMAGF